MATNSESVTRALKPRRNIVAISKFCSAAAPQNDDGEVDLNGTSSFQRWYGARFAKLPSALRHGSEPAETALTGPWR
jgi:hypothetical protein